MKILNWIAYTVGTGAVIALITGGVFRSTHPMTSSAALPKSSYAAALQDGGAVVSAGNHTAPDFTLINQSGKSVSLKSFRGKVVVLTFLDPVCYDVCPVIAQQLVQADKMLGNKSKQVEMVAVVANPLIHSLSAVQAFNHEHELSNVANWEFLTSSSLPALQKVWQDYHIFVNIPGKGRMVMHTQGMYFISPSGKEVYFDPDTGNAHLMKSYASLITAYIDKLLPQTQA